MAWSFYFKRLCDATDEPEEPLDPYVGSPAHIPPRKLLTHREIRHLGRKPFTTSFKIADKSRGMGDRQRVDPLHATERRIKETNPIYTPPPRKYKPFLTSFRSKSPDDMRIYAKQHYSINSGDYQKYCRDRKKASNRRKNSSRSTNRLERKKRTSKSKSPVPTPRGNRQRAKSASFDDQRARSLSKTPKPHVPRLAWSDGCPVEIISPGTEKGSGGRSVVFTTQLASTSSRASASSRALYSARGSNSKRRDRLKKYYSDVGESGRKRTTIRQRVTKKAIIKHKNQQLSPRSRSASAWKIKGKAYVPSPRLSDWES